MSKVPYLFLEFEIIRCGLLGKVLLPSIIWSWEQAFASKYRKTISRSFRAPSYQYITNLNYHLLLIWTHKPFLIARYGCVSIRFTTSSAYILKDATYLDLKTSNSKACHFSWSYIGKSMGGCARENIIIRFKYLGRHASPVSHVRKGFSRLNTSKQTWNSWESHQNNDKTN